MNSLSLNDAFLLLDQWRHFPAYQIERRIDVFVALFLPDIFKGLSGLSPATVIPEFPLHKGKLGLGNKADKQDNQSVKVDFATLSSDANGKRIALVELKTDDKSLSEAQLRNMVRAKCVGVQQLLCGVIKAARASDEKRKYAHLIWTLARHGCLKVSEDFEKMSLKTDRPGLAREYKSENLEVKGDWSDAMIDLVLITPTPPDPSSLNCPDLLKSFRCVDFREIAGYIQDKQSPLGTVLAEYLCKWAREKPGTVNPWVGEKV